MSEELNSEVPTSVQTSTQSEIISLPDLNLSIPVQHEEDAVVSA